MNGSKGLIGSTVAHYNSGLRRILVFVRITSALKREAPLVCHVRIDIGFRMCAGRILEPLLRS
jgi:hypothetical protein